MTLIPVRADFCTSVQYTKVSGSANNTFPNTITVQVETTPLIRGVAKRRWFYPQITKTAEAAESWAGYSPSLGNTENMKAAYRTSASTLFATGPVGCGIIYIPVDSDVVKFDATTNNITDIIPGMLEFETITKVL